MKKESVIKEIIIDQLIGGTTNRRQIVLEYNEQGEIVNSYYKHEYDQFNEYDQFREL